MNVAGGRTNYGEALGILMLDTRFPRLPGDIGNARTFPFPVRYRTVRGASPARVVLERDPSLLEPFIAAARELEAEGVRALTTSCGFLALFQRELAAAVEVPVFSSSLLQIPFLYGMFGHRGKAGVLTARAASLGRPHFDACGVGNVPLAVRGMEDAPEFTRVFLQWRGDGGDAPMDSDLVERELAEAARSLVEREPDVRFLVLECTNMPPFRKAVQEACGRPVFDIVTLACYVQSGLFLT